MAFTIRPHQKSRGGCVACKARRVKCDEARPACRHCARRGAECVYSEPQKRKRAAPSQPAQLDANQDCDTDEAETTSSSTTPAVSKPRARPKAKARARITDGSRPGAAPPPGLDSVPASVPSGYTSKQMLDLRLMHQFGTATAPSIASIFQLNSVAASGVTDVIPKLAIEHPFLMDTILGIAAIHIGSCSSPDASKPIPLAQYRDKALYNLREATMTLSTQNLRPIHMASMLLATTSLAADRSLNYPGLWVINWIAMASGPRVLTESRRASTASSSSSPEPESPPRIHVAGPAPDRPTPAVMPLDLEKIIHIPENDKDWPHRQALREAANGIAELFGALCLHPEGGLTVQFKVRAWPFSLTTGHFIDLARLGRPRALIILAYFLAFVTYLPDTWLYSGVALRDMAKLTKMLEDPFWRDFAMVPSVASTIQDTLARSEFLLTQVDGRPPMEISSPQLSLQAWSLVSGAK